MQPVKYTALLPYLLHLIVLTPNSLFALSAPVKHDYCVVGAGPAGLQMGYFLQTARRDYVVFEKSNVPGSFFQLYPRHRKLISINKRHTGQKNDEFNMRHDWNSLLSHDPELRMTKYSRVMFPDASVLLRYLQDYQTKLNISVQFDTEISNVQRSPNPTVPTESIFTMEDQRGQEYVCRTVIMSTGMAIPNVPATDGIELAKGYENVSIDPEDYEGKSVLILGRGNAAFEVADGIYGSTNLIHMVARSRIRLAWSTHYVGDLRAVNNGLLDTYQLKSLDGLMESSLTHMKLRKEGEKIYLSYKDSSLDSERFDNNPMKEPYDVVIRALGFTFDSSIFRNASVTRGKHRAKKYPAISHNYESVDHQGLFYAGTASHSLDFRKSAGGFIHGFRYTARALHRLLEWRYEGVPWPAVNFQVSQLINTILRRINEASGLYQMFQMLSDVAIFSEDGESVNYLEEFPVGLLDGLPDYTGRPVKNVLVILLEYGQNFSGPGKDTMSEGRSTGEPSEAHTSNFLHPVLYYYKELPSATAMKRFNSKGRLPVPDSVHHIVEDFITQWTAPHSHILPLRRFLENIQVKDFRSFFAQSCFQIGLLFAQLPGHCAQEYMSGTGLSGSHDLLAVASNFGLLSRS